MNVCLPEQNAMDLIRMYHIRPETVTAETPRRHLLDVPEAATMVKQKAEIPEDTRDRLVG